MHLPTVGRGRRAAGALEQKRRNRVRERRTNIADTRATAHRRNWLWRKQVVREGQLPADARDAPHPVASEPRAAPKGQPPQRRHRGNAVEQEARLEGRERRAAVRAGRPARCATCCAARTAASPAESSQGATPTPAVQPEGSSSVSERSSSRRRERRARRRPKARAHSRASERQSERSCTSSSACRRRGGEAEPPRRCAGRRCRAPPQRRKQRGSSLRGQGR